ncbi:hypothetical protein D3C80_1568420 [compost metagenome]
MHVGEPWLPGAPVGEEAFLDALRPGDGIEHADLARQAGEGGIEFGKAGFAHGGRPAGVILEV